MILLPQLFRRVAKTIGTTNSSQAVYSILRMGFPHFGDPKIFFLKRFKRETSPRPSTYVKAGLAHTFLPYILITVFVIITWVIATDETVKLRRQRLAHQPSASGKPGHHVLTHPPRLQNASFSKSGLKGRTLLKYKRASFYPKVGFQKSHGHLRHWFLVS